MKIITYIIIGFLVGVLLSQVLSAFRWGFFIGEKFGYRDGWSEAREAFKN
jgi:hypothetical protein